uniref:Uncharacterized protein n=1 Tax=Oryza sativa subsp. indica TaxID=39946 RepID=A0A679B9G5_ORYSI|nr:hypothetical protein [Oryza sativa Indica Group]
MLHARLSSSAASVPRVHYAAALPPLAPSFVPDRGDRALWTPSPTSVPHAGQAANTRLLHRCRRLMSRFRYLDSMGIVGTRIYARLR